MHIKCIQGAVFYSPSFALHAHPVAARELPLPRATRERIAQLVDWYDTSVDWEYPAGPSLWDADEQERFARAARHLLATLRVQLGAEFDIHDELTATLPP